MEAAGARVKGTRKHEGRVAGDSGGSVGNLTIARLKKCFARF